MDFGLQMKTPEEIRQASNERCRRHYAVNRERAKARSSQWRKTNPERARQAVLIWRAAHPGKDAEYGRKRRETPATRERKRVADRRWRAMNHEWVLAQARVAKAKRRARKSGNGGSYTHMEWMNLCSASGWQCAYCSTVLDVKTSVREHATPISRGGSSGISNIVLSCGPCNRKKYTMTAEEFRVKLAAA
jgi:5-methylcytosine-specific restriction endonuclease McrA